MKNSTKLITCASYGGTGSSAITDLLKEFENVNSMGEFEFAFLHESDGVSDLQHYVVDDFHRLKTDEGIYRFLKLSYDLNYNEGYAKVLKNNKFYEISKEYIEDLTDTSWQGYWHQHQKRYSKLKKIRLFGADKIKLRVYRRYLGKVSKKFEEYTPSFKKSTMRLANVDYDKFIQFTKEYTDKFIRIFNENNKYEFVALDQMVPPINLDRYTNYFNNIKVIVVDRDPRDLYILNEIYWKEGWIPSHDIDTYINWFKLLRNKKENNENVLKVQFEDLIYNYEETVEKILNFLEIDSSHHKYKKQFFIPEKSIRNTKLWEQHKELSDSIDKIYNELREYCSDRG